MATTTMAMATADMDTTTDIAMVIVATNNYGHGGYNRGYGNNYNSGYVFHLAAQPFLQFVSLVHFQMIIISNIKLETVVLYTLELQLWLQQLRTQR